MQMQHHAASDGAKAGAPIAQVLNDTAAIETSTDSASGTHNPSAAPFSGKLVDLLLDVPEQLLAQERRRGEHHYEEPSRINSDNAVITLPQPLQRPTKTVERARIPPLLQGLHQPPPLPPSDRLFPPITDGASGFEQDIRDRIKSANASQEVRAKRKRIVDTIKVGGTKDSNVYSSELDKDGQELTDSCNLALEPGKDAASSANRDERGSTVATKATKGRKRKKWSDEETRDLLLGVSRFGIGKWKRILKCSDYKFEDRTAVDLKDRFRVCCPGEGLKARPSKAKGREAEDSVVPQRDIAISTAHVRSAGDAVQPDPVTAGDACTRNSEIPQTNDRSKLAELGIQTPFAPSTRRARRGFSAQDDENLLKGYEKYGAAWRSIRADESLGFRSRHTTDLRDRFRIRYPELFTQAGYKAKSRAHTKRARSNGDVHLASRTSHGETSSTAGADRARRKHRTIEESDTETQSPDRPAQSRPAFILPSVLDHQSISDHTTSEKDGNGNSVVLNRNILQWADANTFLMTHPSTIPPVVHQVPNDMSMHISVPNDVLHINPMATLNLPMMTYTGPNNSSATPFSHYHSNSGSNLLTVPNSSSTAVPRVTFAMDPVMAHNQWQQHHQQATRVSSSDALLRTPNLPTIVFPHVPVASARTMVHNLPAPADLLSGMDLDGAEGQVQFESGHDMQ